MKTIRPVFGALAGIACLAIWTSISVSDYLAADEADAQSESASSAAETEVKSLINSLAYDEESPEAETIQSMTQEVVKLADQYNSGEVTCQACLTQVDSCIQTLESSSYSSIQHQPVWQQSYEQLVEIRNDLPCSPAPQAGGVVGPEVPIPGSEVITSQQVISQDPLAGGIEVPCDAPILPAPAPLAPIAAPAPISYGGGGFSSGPSFGSFLPLAGLGVGVWALTDDDDDVTRIPATPTR